MFESPPLSFYLIRTQKLKGPKRVQDTKIHVVVIGIDPERKVWHLDLNWAERRMDGAMRSPV